MCKYFKFGGANFTIDTSIYSECDIQQISKKYTAWSKKYNDIVNSLSQKYIDRRPNYISQIVESYCGFDYQHINGYLRGGNDFSNNSSREKADILLLVLLTAPKIPMNSILYRNVDKSFIDQLLLRNKHSKPLCEKGFLSCSLKLLNAHMINDRNPILKLYLSNDINAIYSNAICKRDEEEIILPPNGLMELVKSPYFSKDICAYIYECHLFYFL